MSIRVARPSRGIVVVTIDSPSTVNAITQDMLIRLARAFGDMAEDKSVRAVILTGTGRKAFSTGINLGDAEKVFKMDESDREKDIVHQMERCPFPIIGAINGFAINAGFEISLACDILLASPNAKFIDSHVKLGILPSWGLSQKLPRIVWRWFPVRQGANVARRVSLACQPMGAEEASRHGLVNEIVAEDDDDEDHHRVYTTGVVQSTSGGGDRSGEGDAIIEIIESSDTPRLMAAAMTLARQIAALPRSGVEGYKRCMRDGLAVSYGDARVEERRRAFAQYRALPESFFAKMKEAAGLTPRAKL